MIIGFPTAITFALLCNNGLFDARYTDLFAPPLAIAAGIKMAEIWRSPRWRVAVVALAVYQGVYATSILSRYVNDTRKDMNAALDQVWRPRGTIYASMYANNSPLYAGHGLAPGQGPWDAEWMAVADGYAGMYLTPSGTFRFLRPPLSCREIIYCEGERMREFYQQLYDGNGWDLVHVSKAAAWTPEIKLHHALMMSKWLFSGDIRLYRRRQPAN
jgi:hypothetical protein